MNNLIYSLNATVPIFTIILLGWLLKKINIINDDFVSVNNKLAFNILFPVLLFRDLSTMKIAENFSIPFILTCFLMTAVSIFFISLLSHILIKDKTIVGSFIQGSFRSSAAILGVSIAENLYGNSGMVPMMIIAVVPLYNIYSVILLTLNSRDSIDKKISKKKLALSIAKNPMIVAIFIGIIFSFLQISFPPMISKATDSLSATASPLALLIVGAGFSTSASISKIKPCVIASLIKLIILPVVFSPIAILLGFRNQSLIAILIMLGSPSTVSGYIMAKSMDNDSELASGIVVITTIFSALTVTSFIYIFKMFSLI